MSNKPMQLSTRGLIAAALASTSSYALAEQAGRVSFVTGDVRATATDGSSRSLTRGDIISTGDKISTGGGRLQLRFTDGGFVSLQPNTVFGVDQYLYANKPPEEASVFFSLLQGGMRTITGAIGKVNKQSYKVRTPVATIGIRGTEYLARVNPDRVIVSVGSGFVNVSNDQGNITGGAGQNIEAVMGSGPRMTNDEPDVNATGPEGEREQYASDDSENGRQQRQGDQITIEGNNLVLANGAPPVYTHVDIEQPGSNGLPNGSGYSLQTTDASGNIITLSGLTATFDPVTGSITSLILPSGQETPPLGGGQLLGAATTPVVTGPSFRPGTLQFVNVERYGNISWGEITGGSTDDNSLGIFPSEVPDGEYFGYLIATPSLGYTGGTASYSLRGASAARLNRSDSKGELHHFDLNLNLLTGTAGVDMLVKMDDASIGDITVKGDNLSLNQGSSTFHFGEGLSTSASTNFCSSASGCSTDISGMFVSGGTQAAASYAIRTNTGSNKITGYAALGLDKRLVEQSGFSMALPQSDVPYTGVSVILDADGSLAGAYIPAVCNDGCSSNTFGSGTLDFVNTGKSGDIYWGEMTNGNGILQSDDSFNEAFSPNLGSNQFQSYIVGKAATAMTVAGTAKYSLIGGTARLSNGNMGLTAELDHFDLTLRLDLGQIDLDMSVLLSGEGSQTVSVTGTNILLPLKSSNGSYAGGFGIDADKLTASSTGFFCTSGCSADISGFFTDSGTKIATSYNINSALYGSLDGVAALGTSGTGNSSPTQPLNSGKNYVFAASYGGNILDMGSGTPAPHSSNDEATYNYSDNTFSSTGRLESAVIEQYGYDGEGYSGSSRTALAVDTASSTYADTGTRKALHWGRVMGDSITLDGETQSIAAPGIHYITGVMTTPSAWSDINSTYKGGSAVYSLAGGTSPTDLQGHTGTLSSSSKLTVHLGDNPSLDIALGINSVNGRNYALNSNGNSLSKSSTTFNFEVSNSSISGCASSCSATASGFFAGPQAEQAGLAYTISGNVDSVSSFNAISGVAAFERGAITPGTTPPP